MTKAGTTHDVQIERRVSRRYQSPGTTFVVENSDGRQPLGELLDISLHGLSFIYSEDLDTIQESDQLNVVSTSGEVCLEKIPYKNRTDFDFIRNYPFDAHSLRRRGVSFNQVDPELLRCIETFIHQMNSD